MNKKENVIKNKVLNTIEKNSIDDIKEFCQKYL